VSENIEQVDPVQEQARHDLAEWEPHIWRQPPFVVAGILNDIECEYVGVRHEDYCKMIHFLAIEHYRTQRKENPMFHSCKKGVEVVGPAADCSQCTGGKPLPDYPASKPSAACCRWPNDVLCLVHGEPTASDAPSEGWEVVGRGVGGVHKLV